jgi:hypothetical protein
MSIATIVAILIVWIMPKRLTKQEIYCTWIVMALLTRTSDQVLDQVFHLYDQLEQYNVDGCTNWQVIVLQNLFPAAMGVIILNYMPIHKLTFFTYTIACTLFSVVFEWITIRVHYLTYHNWSLLYSGGVYFLGIIFLRYHLSFLRKSKR